MTDFSADEARFMRRALQLARRGAGHVEPNPMVGCVLVRGERVIAEGYHRRFGGPHAEIEALRRARGGARGATAFVTLEPCNYHGKTPPCTAALIAAGVRRVVAAQLDPNPRVAGAGLVELRRARIAAEVGLLAAEAAALNGPYLKLVRTGRPWVILKWAQSLDGKIATHTGDAKWISDATMRAHAHRTRGRLDAILVGLQTVLTDDPLLTCRVGRPRRSATRVVLDSRLRIPDAAALVRTARLTPTLLFCARTASARRRRQLSQRGCEIVPIAASASGLNLSAVLEELGRRQMTNVLVEGGGRLLGAFFDQHLADELHIYLCPLLIGGRDAPGVFAGRGVRRVRDALNLAPGLAWRRLGRGWFADVCIAGQ